MAQISTFTDTIGGSRYTLSRIGPLTTVFTPPSRCLTSWHLTANWVELGVDTGRDCFPSSLQRDQLASFGYYAPGLCPDSYFQAGTMSPWWLNPGETGYHCCPSQFSLTLLGSWSCLHSLTEDVISTYMDGTVTTTTTFWRVWAPAIHVIRGGTGESPGVSFLTVTLASGPVTTTTEFGVSPSTTPPRPRDAVSPPRPTTEDRNTEPASSSNASTIAVATAVPVVLITLAIFAFIFFRRRARQNDPAATTIPMPTPMPELEGNENDLPMAGPPMPVTPQIWPAPIELPTRRALGIEMSALAETAELAAGPASHTTTPPIAAVPPPAVGPAPAPQDDDEIQSIPKGAGKSQ